MHLLSLEAVRWQKSAVLHDAPRCTGCSGCAGVCPFHAIVMRKPGGPPARAHGESAMLRSPAPD